MGGVSYLNLDVCALREVDPSQLDRLPLGDAKLIHHPLGQADLTGLGGELEYSTEESSLLRSSDLEDDGALLLLAVALPQIGRATVDRLNERHAEGTGG